MAENLIGIKFCGGCRAAYNRREAAERIAEAIIEKTNNNTRYELAKEGQTYASLLVMCGCTNRCANVKPYIVNGEMIYIWGEDIAKDFIENNKP
jgi:hypothetical protein